ncbi:MAG TPA: hypothetical protein VGF27_20355 [Pseudoduganella sp.]
MDNYIWNVPAPMQAFMDVSKHMDEHGITTPLAEIVGQALYAWIAADQAARNAEPGEALHGYQWKSLFLPTGTMLRTVVRNQQFIARVEGDSLIADGRATTPARFASAAHGYGCNAWRSIWLLFPGTKEWLGADSVRAANLRRNK